MMALVALLLLCTVTVLLASGRVHPLVVFALLPPVAALMVGTDLAALSAAVQAGLARTAPVAALFVFAICFAGVMRDAGVFQPLLQRVLHHVGNSPLRLLLGTVLIGMLAHLDGAGPTTFLMAIPVLMPVYDRLGVPRSTLVMLLAMAAGLFNLLPWGGPLGRVSAVTGRDVSALWHALLPAQVIGMALLLIVAACAGWRMQHAGRSCPAPLAIAEQRAGKRYPWHDALLCVLVLALLVSALLPAWLVFMLALGLALPLNHRSVEAQRRCLAVHAPAALELCSVVLSAGVLLGVLEGTGMLAALAKALALALPSGLLAHQHLVIAAFATPLNLLISTDAYYFALLPVVMESATQHGADPSAVIFTMTLSQTVGAYVGPYSTAIWLGLGMTGVDFATHVRRTLPWCWAFATALLAATWLSGLW